LFLVILYSINPFSVSVTVFASDVSSHVYVFSGLNRRSMMIIYVAFLSPLNGWFAWDMSCSKFNRRRYFNYNTRTCTLLHPTQMFHVFKYHSDLIAVISPRNYVILLLAALKLLWVGI